jgi:hypothetical protein
MTALREVLFLVPWLLLASDAGVDEAPPPERHETVAHAAFITALLASNAASIMLGYTPGRVQFEVHGRPDPLVASTGLVITSVAQLAAAYFLLPEAYRLGDGDIEKIRDTAWKYERWSALSGALGLAMFISGSAVERAQYGRGEVLMLIGAALSAASYIAFDVLAIIGSSRGYRQ